MIDIHCHILPETDDGAASLTESLAMAETAANQGIRQIIATPHENGQFTNEAEAIQTAVQDLNERLKQEKDRKSTRLNSSHVANSYAVFCLKKKTKKKKK